MEAVLCRENIRCFDIGLFAEPLRERIRDNEAALAGEAGVEVECLAKMQGGSQGGVDCESSGAAGEPTPGWCMCFR
jgi:hypothetical protein